MALKLMAEIGLDGSGIQRGIEGIRGKISGLAATLGAAFSVGAVTALAKKTIEFAGHITDLSARLGVSTSYLQEMQYVMKQNGGSVDDLTTAFEKLGAARIKALEGDADAQANFAKFGITQQDLKTKDNQDLMDTIGARFKEFGRSDVLVSAFKEMAGKGAGALLPSFLQGIEEERKKFGNLIMTPEQIAQLDEIGDSFDKLGLSLMSQLGPAIISVADVVGSVVTAFTAYAASLGAYFANFDLMKIIKANFSIEGIKGGGGLGEFARQLGGASPEAERTFQEIIQKGENERERARLEREAKLAQKPAPPDYSNVKDTRVTIPTPKNTPAFSDSLLSVGNFLGSGRSALETVAQKQLKAAEKTNVLLERLVNKAYKPAGTINVPK